MPKKLIRNRIVELLDKTAWEFITNKTELNELYALKVQEELAEIQESDHKDIKEFIDLIQVAFCFAKQNGFTHEELSLALIEKSAEKGSFSNIALNTLNSDNPSNKIYLENIDLATVNPCNEIYSENSDEKREKNRNALALMFNATAKIKAYDIWLYFFNLLRKQTDSDYVCGDLARAMAKEFIKLHIIPTLDEPDVIFWNVIISEIETK